MKPRRASAKIISCTVGGDTLKYSRRYRDLVGDLIAACPQEEPSRVLADLDEL
jgi:hypothetical protein